MKNEEEIKKGFNKKIIVAITILAVVVIPIVLYLGTESIKSNVLYEDDLLISGRITDVVYTDYSLKTNPIV